LYFGDRFAVLNDFLYQTEGSTMWLLKTGCGISEAADRWSGELVMRAPKSRRAATRSGGAGELPGKQPLAVTDPGSNKRG
jgi:hypothetical protein